MGAGRAPNICPTSAANPNGWPVAELDPREANPVLFSVEDGIATITLNRPHEGNAISPKMQEDLEKNGVAMGDTPRKSKEKELAALSLEFQRKQREMNEDLNVRRNEELQGVVDRTNKAIKAIAEKEGYDLVLQEAAYINPHVDITDKVIKALADTVPAPAK